MQVLGIDVGGSGIKGALVNGETGEMLTERFRIETPPSFEAKAVANTIAEVARHFNHEGPIGVGFPAAVADGVVLTPPTAHEVPGWINQSVNEVFSSAIGQPVQVLNDADAAGLAEMRFGAGVDVKSVTMTVTLGTGVGGGLFMNGKLVPNLEIGKIYLKGHKRVAEQYMASRIRKEENLSWKQYGKRLREFFRHIELVFSPELIIIGGGVSQKHEQFLSAIKLERSHIVPARLLNEAGIIGAAIWASETSA